MLRGHLKEMVRSRMRLVMVAIIVISIVMLIMIKHDFRSDRTIIIVMNFGEEVVADVASLKYEQ